MPDARARRRGMRQIERGQRENAEIERGRREMRDVGWKGEKQGGRGKTQGVACAREIEGEGNGGREGDEDHQRRIGQGGHATAASSVLMRNIARNYCFEPAIRNACAVCRVRERDGHAYALSCATVAPLHRKHKKWGPLSGNESGCFDVGLRRSELTLRIESFHSKRIYVTDHIHRSSFSLTFRMNAAIVTNCR